jgi:predicted transcriptional regulator of viral defense system
MCRNPAPNLPICPITSIFYSVEGVILLRKSEAQAHLQVSEAAFKLAANRLFKKRRIVTPRRGFFVIVPDEYHLSGSPPATWYIDALMKFHEQPYYVALLSAAALHGAAHQQPQELQVMTTSHLRPIHVGRDRIRFFMKKDLGDTPTQKIKGATGFFPISTPEATAFDLIRYLNPAGHTATVLYELREEISPSALADIAKTQGELASTQRLGYLLDYLKSGELTAPLYKWLKKQQPSPVTLVPTRKRPRSYKRNDKWSVIINEEIEVD